MCNINVYIINIINLAEVKSEDVFVIVNESRDVGDMYGGDRMISMYGTYGNLVSMAGLLLIWMVFFHVEMVKGNFILRPCKINFTLAST